MLVTQSALPSGATPMPCDGESVRRSCAPKPLSGSLMRSTSLRAAKSITAKPLRLESCAKMRRVEPSGAFSIAIGRTPSSSLSSQAILSDARSITVSTLVRIEPVITCLLSGVT